MERGRCVLSKICSYTPYLTALPVLLQTLQCDPHSAILCWWQSLMVAVTSAVSIASS